MQTTIGFIGSGNMAECIASGLIKKQWDSKQIMVFSPNAVDKAWIQHNQIRLASNITQLTDNCEMLILATKPQQAQRALAEVSLTPKQCLISVAAGISISFINQVLSSEEPNHIIRAMPNTPSLIDSGICGLFADNSTRDSFGEIAESIFSSVGSFVWVKQESLMDAVTAISGSGPAYYFLFLEGMISAGIELGLEKDVATKLATDTFSGAAALLKSKETDPTLLRQQVTSPGGTTAAAIGSFQDNNLQQVILKAVSTAKDRGILLNKDCLNRLKNKQ